MLKKLLHLNYIPEVNVVRPNATFTKPTFGDEFKGGPFIRE